MEGHESGRDQQFQTETAERGKAHSRQSRVSGDPWNRDEDRAAVNAGRRWIPLDRVKGWLRSDRQRKS